MTHGYSFPDNFIWGVATSSHQIEGAPLEDGAGPSNWYVFSRQPGRIVDGDTADIACDHYRRYGDDIELMQELALDAYRFSVSWSRVFPEGRGRVNPKGLDFYHRLVDGLLAAGIQPFLTLYHWDLPDALERQGGWLNRDSAFWFADYAQALFRAFGGRVSHWMTLNEPWVVMHEGYVRGTHAPGHASLREAPLVTHNLLRAHALGVQAFRAEGEGQIGLVVNLEPKYAASETQADRIAANRAHAYMNRQYLDPVLLGSYPDEMPDIFGHHWPRFSDEDMRLLRQPVDFIGVNYYSRSVNRADPKDEPVGACPVRQDAEHTEMGWEVYPDGLRETLVWIKRRYGEIPLYVTENGAAFADPAPVDGRIDDHARVDYLRQHLRAAHAAISAGVDLRGYFAWSLLDNFEWSFGFSKRFGLVRVDPVTLQRTPKASARFYADVIRSNGAILRED